VCEGMGSSLWFLASLFENMPRARDSGHPDYKPTVLKQYHIVWNKLCKRAGVRPANDFDMEFGMKFLDEAMRAHPKNLNENSKHRWIKAIYTLADFKRTGILSLRREKRGFVFSELAKSAFQQYTAHQSAIGLSEAHIRDTCLYLERFSKYLEQQCLENIAGLDTRHVQGFVNSLAIYELPTIYNTTCVLRRALRYLYAQGIITTDLSTVVPKIRYCKKAKIPSAYSIDEIERMVNSIDRGNPRGKRDYALILLAARLGLRASDIANLTFSNFKWDKNIIEVAQQKTGEPVTLPLLNDVGEAIIYYIRYARPKSDEPFLFLKLNGPKDVMYANSIHHTVYARLKEAGIRIPPGKKHGPHALRHSLASALLEHNVPMPVISEALGHTDTESTSVYLKIDVARLRECAVEVSAFCGGHESQFGGAHPSCHLHAGGDYLDEFYESLRVGRLESRSAQTLGKVFRCICLCNELGHEKIPSSLAAGTGRLQIPQVDFARQFLAFTKCGTVRDCQLSK
jgi:integrase/recombinase XerD